MTLADYSGYIASTLVFLTFYMKTMVPLRLIGISSNCAFIVYGYLDGLYPVLILHLILLPLNCLRLQQILKLTRQVSEATQGDLNMEWLRPFTSVRRLRTGDILFRKGDVADQLFIIVSGRFRLVETGVELAAPEVVGEVALLTSERVRTQTVECIDAGSLLHIGYNQVEQLFFQNPTFGFYLLKLVAQRLLRNVAMLETRLAGCIETLEGKAPHGELE